MVVFVPPSACAHYFSETELWEQSVSGHYPTVTTAIEVGSVGAALMAVVPLSEVYIEANYREVQLGHVRAGQRARIHVDAYNIDLEGKVVDVPAASGTTFATLQPDNATGNFTKIVQRLPIKIVLAPHQPTARLLRVGLSVEATIETKLADVVAASR